MKNTISVRLSYNSITHKNENSTTSSKHAIIGDGKETNSVREYRLHIIKNNRSKRLTYFEKNLIRL